MATKKVGEVIREARAAAGLTQEKLAAKISGVSALDISRVERGEANLTNEQLKRVAKALKVTQASLLNAPKNGETAKAKSSASTAKKTATSTAKKTAASPSALKLTAEEKTFLKAYRAATAEARMNALNLLTEKSDGGIASALGDVLSDVLGGLIK